jgi:hypothetical protein
MRPPVVEVTPDILVDGAREEEMSDAAKVKAEPAAMRKTVKRRGINVNIDHAGNTGKQMKLNPLMAQEMTLRIFM